MVQVIQHWVFHTMAMKKVVEVLFLQVMMEKTKVAKGLEINGVAQNVGIHVLVWNVSSCSYYHNRVSAE